MLSTFILSCGLSEERQKNPTLRTIKYHFHPKKMIKKAQQDADFYDSEQKAKCLAAKGLI